MKKIRKRLYNYDIKDMNERRYKIKDKRACKETGIV